MLPSQTLAWAIRRQGKDAGYRGLPQGSCPYKTGWLLEAWCSGWVLGAEDRKFDMSSGTHPELEYHRRVG